MMCCLWSDDSFQCSSWLTLTAVIGLFLRSQRHSGKVLNEVSIPAHNADLLAVVEFLEDAEGWDMWWGYQTFEHLLHLLSIAISLRRKLRFADIHIVDWKNCALPSYSNLTTCPSSPRMLYDRSAFGGSLTRSRLQILASERAANYVSWKWPNKSPSSWRPSQDEVLPYIVLSYAEAGSWVRLRLVGRGDRHRLLEQKLKTGPRICEDLWIYAYSDDMLAQNCARARPALLHEAPFTTSNQRSNFIQHRLLEFTLNLLPLLIRCWFTMEIEKRA